MLHVFEEVQQGEYEVTGHGSVEQNSGEKQQSVPRSEQHSDVEEDQVSPISLEILFNMDYRLLGRLHTSYSSL